VLYEAVSGRKPFTGSSHETTVRATLEGHAAPIEDLGDAALSKTISRAMAREPAARFASAAEMAAALDESTSTGAPTVAVRPPPRTRTLPRAAPPRARPLRANRRILSCLVAVALLVAIAVAAVVLTGDDAGGPAPGTTTTVAPAVPGGAQLPPQLERELARLQEAINR
jgi:serine/threonine-protein kinase